MRLSTTALLALPLLAAAAESPFEQYKAKFQNFLGSFGSSAPDAEPEPEEPSTPQQPVGEPEDFLYEGRETSVMTLENWKDLLYDPVKPGSTVPVEWWLLVTGGNKTCYGHCQTVEAAFYEANHKLAALPDAPYTATLNCDEQPVLCNSWTAHAGTFWLIEMLPEPAPINIYTTRLNLTATTSQYFLDLHAQDTREGLFLMDSYFHPFDGLLAKNGLSVPLGYLFYYFSLIPSWATMLIVSYFSRTMMSRRASSQANQGAAGARRGGAPPGDGRS